MYRVLKFELGTKESGIMVKPNIDCGGRPRGNRRSITGYLVASFWSPNCSESEATRRCYV
jgi:hypothetical protein